jgi:hypothetical protein
MAARLFPGNAHIILDERLFRNQTLIQIIKTMTKKDLFKIILKFYGLYSLIGVIVQIPNLIYYFYFDRGDGVDWLMLLIPAASILVIYLLIFRPGPVVDLFKLDKGFDNDDVSKSGFNGKGITKIALVIIAVYLIVNNIADFITQVIFSFKESVSRGALEDLLQTIRPNPFDYQIMINSGISLLIGFLLLTNHTRLSAWIEKINAKNAE